MAGTPPPPRYRRGGEIKTLVEQAADPLFASAGEWVASASAPGIQWGSGSQATYASASSLTSE